MPMYSEHNPKLQVSWDSTSLDALLFCPRRYQYEILEGWRGRAVDLEFGGFVASALEQYQKLRCEGKTRHEALMPVLRWLLEATWNEDGSQWGGEWADFWKCDGSEPYKNRKGNRAKCPYSHKNAWFPQPAPDMCGECGGGIMEERMYVPGDDKKNRISLLRAITWYVEDQREDLDAGLRPFVFPDGTPAVELSWTLPMALETPYGERYVLCGHIDYIGQYGTEVGPVDNKTTGKTLGKAYWQKYEPSTQLDTYDMAAHLLFEQQYGLKMDWIAVDAIQLLANDVRTGRKFFRKTKRQREEHMHDMGLHIKRAESYAEAGHWPMEKRNCWMCPFKAVCGSDPTKRERLLADNFTRKFWDPTESR